MPSQAVAGKWTFRSFHNDPVPIGGDAQKALALIILEATMTIEPVGDTALTGAVDWSNGGLDLRGVIFAAVGNAPLTIEMIGTGRPGTETAGWQSDYSSYLAHQWPNGIGQLAALVGNVVRAKPHGTAPAGYVGRS